jgi:hypothetical protein
VRKLLTAVASAAVIVAMAAAVSFAATPPEDADFGLERAAEQAGFAVPVQNGQDAAPAGGQADDQDRDENEPEETVEEAQDATGEHCSVDPRGASPEVLAELNHGAIACWAAQQETPDGFDNHGKWVSSWAKQNHGQDTAAEKGAAKSENGQRGRGHGRGQGAPGG